MDCQAIIWTSSGIFLIWTLETNFSEMFIGIHKSSFNKMQMKMSPPKCEPFYLDLSVLKEL